MISTTPVDTDECGHCRLDYLQISERLGSVEVLESNLHKGAKREKGRIERAGLILRSLGTLVDAALVAELSWSGCT